MTSLLVPSAAVLLLVFLPLNSSISADDSTAAAQAKRGLTGSYYVRSPTWHAIPAQVSMDPNDFRLPRLLTAPAAVRVDPQIAFGKGKAFVMKGEDQQTIWWPTGYAMPPGWTGVARFDMKAWDPNLFAAVIWKGYIRLPKAGTYYFATVSTGPAAVYLGQARVALAGSYNGLLI